MKPDKKLIAKWYKKLKAGGFEDIEKDEYTLKEYHSVKFKAKRVVGWEEKQRYYEVARQLLHTFPFTSKESRHIWKLHADGKSVEHIVEVTGVSKEAVVKSIEYVAGHIKNV